MVTNATTKSIVKTHGEFWSESFEAKLTLAINNFQLLHSVNWAEWKDFQLQTPKSYLLYPKAIVSGFHTQDIFFWQLLHSFKNSFDG